MVTSKSQTMQHTIILLLFILHTLTIVSSNNNDNTKIELPESFEDLLLDDSQRDIFRRWLSESEPHNTEEHSYFKLSLISDDIDKIIKKYEDASEWKNDSIDENSNTRRSLLTNEGEWTCNTTSHILSSFESVSHELELFTEYNCTDHEEHEEHEEHVPDGVYIVLYCGFVLFIGVLLKYIQHRFHIPIPYTVLLLLVGVILETIEIADGDIFGHLNLGFTQVRNIDPHMVLSLFIPGLIFESAFNTNYHIFLKEAQQAAMLAGPGVVVNALLIGGVMHYFAHSISLFSSIDPDGYDWSWSFSIMFGSIVSATDPVAVVALLKELGASKRLSTLIEAESLLNDGTAFVLFTVLKLYAAAPANTTFGSMIVIFLQLAFGGWFWGILSGALCCYVLSNVYNDFEIEITLTLSLVYLFAYTADFVFHVSGVLTIVFMGLWVSKNKEAISPHVEEAMHHFWEMVGFIANTVLFFLTGQVIAFRIHSESDHIHWGTDMCILIMLYIFCHIIRGLAIWQMHPVLKNTGYGCTFEDSCVMVWGGLRGAIGLALALIVETEEAFPKLDRDRVLFHVCGIVTLTLIINAPTVKLVVKYLGLNKPPSDTAALFKSATQHLIDDIHHKLNEMKLDKHYIGANWLKVDQLQPSYNELYFSIFDEEMEDNKDDNLDDLSIGEDPELIINMLAELQCADRELKQKQSIEKRVISVMKSSYWTQYEKGLISADAVNILVESSEDAMDEHDLTKQRKNLKKWFSIPWYIKHMHQSQIRFIKKISEWLLFGNLGFAVEIASGFVYASKSALEFCHLLLHNNSIDNKHVKFVEQQLLDVTNWIEVTGSDVVRVYPEVHTAIQTKHAAHSLLNYQKESIDHLLHKGFLDEAEHGRVMSLCETSLNNLFHTSYTDLLDHNHDDESILLQSPLFSELSIEEKKLVIERAKPSKWYKKGEYIMRENKKNKRLFVITRGTIFIYKNNRTHIHTKERGDVLDVYALLQDSTHDFNFMISTDQCHGYWLDLSLLKLLKDSNIDFWDTLWKCSACDVIKYYFDNKVNVSDNNLIYQSPLSFFDPANRYRCEIRINRGIGILLNGQVVHITDMNTKAFAPAILPINSEPYVAIEDSVVLYLDFNRSDYHSQNTSHLNPKLAKLMGLKNPTTPIVTNNMNDDDEFSLQTVGDDDQSLSVGGEQKDNEEEKEFLNTTTVPLKKENTNTNKRLITRQQSNIGQIGRYRSKNQLNKAGRKEIISNIHTLNEKQLPQIISSKNIQIDWSIKECFEVVKFIVAKHEGLFEHIKKFHVRHLQDEILRQYSTMETEYDEEEDIVNSSDNNSLSDNDNGITRPTNIKMAAKSYALGVSNVNSKSLFARPSSRVYKKKLSMNDIHNTSSHVHTPDDNINKRKMTLDSHRYRSSRYILSQQRGHGIGAIAINPTNINKQISNSVQSIGHRTPAIITPKGYSEHTKRKSQRMSNKYKNINSKNINIHHQQESTQIDGWEDITNNNNVNTTTPLKDDTDMKNQYKNIQKHVELTDTNRQP